MVNKHVQMLLDFTPFDSNPTVYENKTANKGCVCPATDIFSLLQDHFLQYLEIPKPRL